MKTLILAAAPALALVAPAHARGWAQTNPNGYTYGRTADGRSFWTQTNPDGYTYGHVDAPLPSGHVVDDCIGATDPGSLSRCFDSH
jgi:hypothetical protein